MRTWEDPRRLEAGFPGKGRAQAAVYRRSSWRQDPDQSAQSWVLAKLEDIPLPSLATTRVLLGLD